MKKNRNKTKITLLAIVSIIVFAGVFVLVNNYCISITKGIYVSEKVNNNIKIVLISDLHGKNFGFGNRILADTILTQNPDMVLMSGDMINENCNIDSAKELTKILTRKTEVYYSFGNHEEKFNEEEKNAIVIEMQDAGAVVLNNASTTFVKGETQINIYGFDMPLYLYSGYDDNNELIYTPDTEQMNGWLGESTEYVDILIAHCPVHIDAYAAWGADIVVSGHNHGGTVRLPFIGPVMSPNGDIKHINYDCGEYKSGKCVMYLSRGLGEWAGPVRVFNLPEIYVIELLPES